MIRNTLTREYVDFSVIQLDYVKLTVGGSRVDVEIPMSVVQSLSFVQQVKENKVFKMVEFAVNMGSQRRYLRVNRFEVYVSFGNSDNSVSTFAWNVDEQVTDGCKTTNDDCVVIADINTETMVCEDVLCLSQRLNNVYQVGDNLVVLVKFKDESFAKFISNVSAFFKGDDVVLNFSHLVRIVSQKEGVTVFVVPLVQPSLHCIL